MTPKYMETLRRVEEQNISFHVICVVLCCVVLCCVVLCCVVLCCVVLYQTYMHLYLSFHFIPCGKVRQNHYILGVDYMKIEYFKLLS